MKNIESWFLKPTTLLMQLTFMQRSHTYNIYKMLTVPVQSLFRIPNKDYSFPQITSVQW